MRAALDHEALTLAPEEPATLTVEVTNDLEVIDGIRATLDLGAGVTVSCEPALLPLFPDGTGQLQVTLRASATYPAGDHAAWVELRSAVQPDERVRLPVTVTVPERPAAELTSLPALRSHRTHAEFLISCENRGNTPIELSLAASDALRALVPTFEPPTVTVAPGETAETTLEVRARRQWFGIESRRPVTVVATGEHDLTADVTVAFNQKPMISRGVRTGLVLALIVGMWALIFLFALNKALAQDSLTKDVPPSFYAASTPASPTGALSAQEVAVSKSAGGGSPAGAVPKEGVVIGVGGTVSGTVTAKTTSIGVPRITVQAVRDAESGPVLVSSAATGADGTYNLDGLLPGRYLIHFTANGYKDLWYPAQPTMDGAKPVLVKVNGETSGVNAVLTGLPGSITGLVDTSQTPAAPVTVTVQAAQGSVAQVAQVQTDAQGQYTVTGLPTPGTYDLSFTSPGYQVATDVEELTGGQNRIANTVPLTAANGSISGTVTDGKNPLGGVSITANANGTTVTSATPTAGAVGNFTIPNLATPATYLLTFTLNGFGTQSMAVHLAPGQSVANLTVTLQGGAGQVSGTVTSSSGAPLGGVQVTVNGGVQPVTTASLTGGSVGAYLVSGLNTPGSYTLTFSLPGYQSQTVGVTLGSNGSASGINVSLPLLYGTISGTVTAQGFGSLAGVTVTVTDGTNVRTTVTASSPAGSFSLAGLPPAAYSVTFSLAGYQSQTALVTLTPGAAPILSITMVKAT